MTTDDQPAWAGFWKRIGAFFVDSLIVGAAGYAVGAVAFDALAALGPAARLIGFALALGYFGVLGSRIGGGQTLGKRLFRLRVVGLDGGQLPLSRALLRASVLSLPFVVNGIALRSDGGVLVDVVAVLAATALFGLGLAQIYLLIFNRPSRRLVHDLLARSVVLRADGAVAAAVGKPVHARVAMGIVVGVFVLVSGLTLYFTTASSGFLARLKPPLNSVEALPEVMTASVSENTTVAAVADGGKTTTHALVVSARLRAWPRDPGAEVERVGRAALAAYHPAPGQALIVALRYGFDVGFASGWRGYNSSIPALPPSAPKKAHVASLPVKGLS